MRRKTALLSKSFLIFLSTILSLVLGSFVSSFLIFSTHAFFDNNLLSQSSRNPTLLSWLAILSELFALVFIVALNHFFFKIKVSFFNRNFALGLRVALPSFFFVFINFTVFSSRHENLTNFQIFTAVSVSLLVGIFEEYAARGLMLGNLLSKGKQTFNYLTAVIISAVFFAALHLVNLFSASLAVTAVQIIYVFGLGLIFASAYVFSKNLSVTILLHALIDGLAFAADPRAILGLGNPKVTLPQFVFQGFLLLLFLYYTRHIFKKSNQALLNSKWS